MSESESSAAPRVFGVEMRLSTGGLLYELQLHDTLNVSALKWRGGWSCSIGARVVGVVPLAEVGATIERELSAIADAIIAAKAQP